MSFFPEYRKLNRYKFIGHYVFANKKNENSVCNLTLGELIIIQSNHKVDGFKDLK